MITFKKFHRIMSEGGAFGHLSHPFDVNSFKFNDFKDIINGALEGKLDYMEEKTDAVNIMLTVKDGQVLAARNKSHLKNRGENAMDINAVGEKFKGRPIGEAYVQAMKDFEEAVSSLSKKQVDKIFQNGENWMSMEVMMPSKAENIIKYGLNELRLHGTIKHNLDGEPIENINKENARMLDGMLRQIEADRQEKFNIKKLDRITLPKQKDFNKLQSKYIGELNGIMKSLGAKPGSTMREVKLNYFNTLINKVDKKRQISKDLRNALLLRWVDSESPMNLRVIKSKLPKETVAGISDIEKHLGEHHKKITLPLETLFLKLGAEVLKKMSSFMALNPNEALADMKKQAEDTANKVLKSGDPKLKEKLNYELNRLNSIGGWDAVIPSEGITFFYKGQLLKLTGTFAPINQLIGLRFRIKD